MEAQERVYRRLFSEWDEVIEKIRQLDVSNFLQPIPFTTLRKAAAEGRAVLSFSASCSPDIVESRCSTSGCDAHGTAAAEEISDLVVSNRRTACAPIV